MPCPLLVAHLCYELAAQLTERRTGNEHYKQQRFEKALRHYERALSIVELVQGLSSSDQAEIESNKQSVLLNIAAVHLAAQSYGQAVKYCTRVLSSEPTHTKALMRRAKALTLRHEYKVKAIACSIVEAHSENQQSPRANSMH